MLANSQAHIQSIGGSEALHVADATENLWLNNHLDTINTSGFRHRLGTPFRSASELP